MKLIHCLLVSSVALVQACSKEAWQRAGYETLQDMQVQQCEKELSADCADSMRYEDYQQQRTRLPSE